jgi:hypothetical protein
MTSTNESNSENSKVFEVFTNDSKKYEISMKKVIETDKLMLHMILMEGSQKKIFCSLYDIELLRHIKVLSPYDTTEEIFQQICDYLDANKQLNIKSSIIIHANKVELIIPINSKKYKQLNFELKSENSELVEILLDTVDNLMKKNEEFEKRITALEEKVFGIKKREKEGKNVDNILNDKIENLTNTKNIQPHTSYISNIILLQNGKIASSSHDSYIKIYNKDTFEIEISIKENSYVDWIEQIKDGTLISCPRDKTIRLYEINDKSYKNINVINMSSSSWKMKELINGKIISTTDNSEIKIWIKKDNTLECEFTLKNDKRSFDILEVRNNEVVALSGNNINFYDLNKRKKIISIPGFEPFNLNPGKKFCVANDELLFVCGNQNIFSVNFQTYQLICKIECKGIITLYKLSNNFIFSGQYNGDIKQWKCNGGYTKLYSIKKSIDNSPVLSLFKLNNLLISGDRDGNIKYWEFK